MATTTLGNLLLQLNVSGQRAVTSALNSVARSTDNLNRSTGKASKAGFNFTGVILSLTKGLTGLGIAFGVIDGFNALTKMMENGIRAGFKYNRELDLLHASMESLTQSQETANKLTNEMIVLAAETPFAIKDFAKAAKTLLGYGVVQEEVMEDMQMLGDISLGDAQSLDRLSLAFGQVTAKGKLQAEEVRQMVNAGFNPLQIISEKTGHSIEYLTDVMRKGGITTEMVRDSMKDATGEGGRFYNSMENLSKTFGGQVDKMKEYGTIFWGNITKPFFDILASRVFPIIVNHLIRMGEKGESMGNSLLDVAKKGFKFAKFIYDLAQPFISTGLNILADVFEKVKNKLTDFASVAESFFKVMKNGDAASIEIMLKAILPDWLEDKAVRIANAFVYFRDNFTDVIQSLFNVLSGGKAQDIEILLKTILPEDMQESAGNIAKIFVQVRDAVMKFKDYVVENIPKVKDAVVGFITKAVPVLRDLLLPIWKKMVKAIADIDWDAVTEGWTSFKDAILDFWTNIKPALAVLGGVLYTVYSMAYSFIISLIESFGNLVGVATNIMAIVTDVFNFIIAIFGDNEEEVDRITSRLVDNVIRLFQNLWDTAVNIFTGFFQGIVDTCKTLYDVVVGHSIIPDMVNGIINWINKLLGKPVQVFNTMKSKMTSALSSAYSYVTSKAKSIYTSIKSKWDLIKTTTSVAFSYVRNKAKEKMASLVAVVASEIARAITKFNKLKSDIQSKISSINLYRHGQNLIQGLINGINSKLQAAKNAVSNIASTVKSYLGWSSPTKEGAGKDSDKWIPNLMEMMIGGFKKYRNKLRDITGQLSSTIGSSLTSATPNIAGTAAAGATTNNTNSNFNIVINAGSGVSGNQIGQQLVYELNKLGVLTHK